MEHENEWANRLIGEMRRCNALVLNIHGEQYQQPGWPDIYIAHTYVQGFVEFKGFATKLESHQKSMLRKLNQRGVPAFLARYPNLIQNYEGLLLHKFGDTGNSLINTLARIEEIKRNVQAD